jgi:diamine N-acetyltransferase
MQSLQVRSIEDSDISAIHTWLNDKHSLFTVGRACLSYEEVQRDVAKKRLNGDRLFAFESQKQLVGWGHLGDIEHYHGRAKIGILLSPEHRGKGFGYMAMENMIEVGFQQLRLNRIYLTTRGFNEQAIKLYRKLGFILEGTLRNHCFVNGQYHDTLFMGLLANEWRK